MNIDPEFKSLVPQLTEEELKGLEESILSEGCRDPLVLWDDTLLDGHNRYEICTHHGIEFKTIDKNFTHRDQAKLWIINNQLSRRNLTPEQASYLRGIRYKVEKKGAVGFVDRNLSGDQNEHREKTAEKLSKELGVSPATIRRDEKFADAVDALTAKEKQKVLSGKSRKTKRELIGEEKVKSPKKNFLKNNGPKEESEVSGDGGITRKEFQDFKNAKTLEEIWSNFWKKWREVGVDSRRKFIESIFAAEGRKETLIKAEDWHKLMVILLNAGGRHRKTLEETNRAATT